MRSTMTGLLMAAGFTLVAAPALAQKFEPGEQSSLNMQVLSHMPLGRVFTVADVEIEQELSRPYAYVSRLHGTTKDAGTTIISVKDPGRAVKLYEWRIPDAAQHHGKGGVSNKYFKVGGRYYDVQSLQFDPGTPDADAGAHVLDVTGLPDTSKVVDLGYVRAADTPGGFQSVFLYKHADKRVLMFATTTGPWVNVYDMARFVAGDRDLALVGRVPIPETAVQPRTYDDMYVAYDPGNKRDVFYGAGAGGYYVYDVAQPESARLMTSITGGAGVTRGGSISPDPTGRYAITQTEYQYSPLRLFDLKPGLDSNKVITRPTGAWTADWKGLSHRAEVRWPYAFVASYQDGLQIINLMDPSNPYTVGLSYTYDGPLQAGWGGAADPEKHFWDRGVKGGADNGAFGVDVRNADGLIVVSDMTTGFWTLKMDGFQGWNGNGWGLPNISSVQDWDNGPEGAVPPRRVS
ncbi:MAG: hypothetical protein EXR93_01375 [Gemmatimonadetes bacterium]|nr:hypothetical protein [Gemmatimonadota bacterium]